MEKRMVCYHEAGHAVVHAYFDHAIRSATVVPDDERDILGNVTSQALLDYRSNIRRAIVRESILASYAGSEAEKIVNPHFDPDHSGSDFNLAYNLLREYPPPRCMVGDDVFYDRLEYYRKQSAKLVRKLWTRIERVAEELEERDSLTADEIYAICDGINI